MTKRDCQNRIRVVLADLRREAWRGANPDENTSHTDHSCQEDKDICLS